MIKRLWLPCLFIALLYLLAYKFNSQMWTGAVDLYEVLGDRQRLKETLSSYGHYSPLIFVLAQSLQVVVAFIPGVAIEFVGGYLFGVWTGFLYSMTGITLGSCFTFGLARVFERVVVERMVLY